MPPKYFPTLMESEDVSALHVKARLETEGDGLNVTIAEWLEVVVETDAVFAFEPQAASKKTAIRKMAATTSTRSVGL